jgi:hypothetical protein
VSRTLLALADEVIEAGLLLRCRSLQLACAVALSKPHPAKADTTEAE